LPGFIQKCEEGRENAELPLNVSDERHKETVSQKREEKGKVEKKENIHIETRSES
jgi:hypothetical protein